MKRTTLALACMATLASAALVGCGGGGGGGGGSTAVAPVAPQSSGSNQLVGSMPVNFAALALVSPSAQQVAAWNAPKTWQDYLQAGTTMLAKAITSPIRSAMAQMAPGSSVQTSTATTTNNTCNVKSLVGVTDDGTEDELNLTEGSTDLCVGVTDMFDGKNYVLLATEGIYKDDKVCNLVFVQKSTGTLFCVGENQRSRYSFTRRDGQNWKKYEILQATENGNYIFLETKVDLFSDAGDKTGEMVKIIRFDLSDSNTGPVAATVLEGENTAWYNWGNSGDTSYFSIFGYSGLENGDLAASYQISLYNNTFNQWAYNNDSAYFRFNADSGEFVSSKVDLNSFSNSSNNGGWWEQIRCYLRSGDTGFNFVTQVNGTNSLVKGVYNTNTQQVSLQTVGETKLCQDWGPSTIAAVGSNYYGIAQTSGGSWLWDQTTGQYTGTIQFELFTRDVSGTSDTTLATLNIQRNWATPSVIMAPDASRAFVAFGAYEEWKWNNQNNTTERKQFGAEIFQINLPAGTNTQVLQSNQNIWISAISNIGSNGALTFSGRDLTKPLFEKIEATIGADGTLAVQPSAAAGNRQTFSVIKL